MMVLTILSLSVFAQTNPKKHTISGYMKDSLSTESLIGATVFNKANFAGTSTNQYGFYSLTLPAGELELVYSYVGYNAQVRRFKLMRDTTIHVLLEGSMLLQEVEIRADRIQERTQMSAVSVPVTQIKSLPAFLGEVDLMKSLQLMPGIQSGGEGSSGLYVRGGGPDQNLILLDGVPVYNASHLFGFFSVFNADAINNVELLKGGFPARYGGRVSSVIDINMKEGNMKKFHGEGAVGIVSAKLTLEGPIQKDRSSFIISGRRTYIDILAKPVIKEMNKQYSDNKIDVGYYFYDLTAKVNYRFSEKNRIFLSAYMGDDKFHADEETRGDEDAGKNFSKFESGLKWGNITGAFRWNHIFTPRLFGNTTITYSRYRFFVSTDQRELINSESNYFSSLYQSGINDWSGKIVFDYLPSPEHYIRYGVNAIYHTFNPGAIALTEDWITLRLGNNKIYTGEYSLFFEDDIRLTSRLKANAGIHWSGFSVRSKFYQLWQPRISTRYLLTPQLSVKASYSRMAQYVHLLTNSNVGLPTDLWVPTTDKLKPQSSHQIALGFAQNFREEYEISIEGYFKTMDNVLEYKEGATFLDTNDNWEDKVLQGKGNSYGVEFFTQKKTGSFTGWIGYTLAWSMRKFELINNGLQFPYKYDRRHDLSITLTKRFGQNIELSGVWVFGTGNCITVPIAAYFLDPPINRWRRPSVYYDYGTRNGYRMEPYHRMDLSISFIKKKNWGERRWIIGTYNTYSRKNPYYIDVKTDVNTGKFIFEQYSIFPIIPSISYQFKF